MLSAKMSPCFSGLNIRPHHKPIVIPELLITATAMKLFWQTDAVMAVWWQSYCYEVCKPDNNYETHN